MNLLTLALAVAAILSIAALAQSRGQSVLSWACVVGFVALTLSALGVV